MVWDSCNFSIVAETSKTSNRIHPIFPILIFEESFCFSKGIHARWAYVCGSDYFWCASCLFFFLREEGNVYTGGKGWSYIDQLWIFFFFIIKLTKQKISFHYSKFLELTISKYLKDVLKKKKYYIDYIIALRDAGEY